MRDYGLGRYEPINTRTRESSPNTASRETVTLENTHVPRLNASGSEQNSSTALHGPVNGAYLLFGCIILGIEPIHTVHYYCNC